MIDGKFILGIINYFILNLILIFGIVSLVLVDQRKKLSFLFLMYLSAGIASFLFFAGAVFALTGIIIIFFFLLLFSLVFQQEFFGYGKDFYIKNIQKKYSATTQTGIIANLIISILSCLFIGYLLVIYTQDFYKNAVKVKSFSPPAILSILNDIGLNYIPVILIITFAVAVSFIWFIAILPDKRVKN